MDKVNESIRNSLMNSLKWVGRLLCQLLQLVGRNVFTNNRLVIVSQAGLGSDELNEIKKRILFFVPTLIDRVKFVTVVSPVELLSARPILTFGVTSLQSLLIRKIRRSGVFNIDYRNNPVDGWEWCRLSQYFAAEKPSTNDAQRRLHVYVDHLKSLDFDKCYVFGTGTSLAHAIERDWSDGYRVVCNTIVRDAELWKHINPHFIVAGDAIYHFGFTEFARAFRADLAKRLAETETYFVFPDEFSEIVTRELGSFSERLVAVPQGTHDRFLVDILADFELPGTGNVLNLLLLPLGCTLSKNVYLWGFDGRAPDDKLFWSNSPKHSYPELMGSLLKAHPAFFKALVPSENPTEYVKKVHGDELDVKMKSAELQGWKFIMMHESWTPILQKRFLGDSCLNS